MFLEYVLQNLSYIVVVVLNVWIIYIVFNDVTSDDGDDSEDDSEGGIEIDDPVLDLPPGVTLPQEPADLVTQ